jgi:hypothetical protein
MPATTQSMVHLTQIPTAAFRVTGSHPKSKSKDRCPITNVGHDESGEGLPISHGVIC